MIQLVFCIQISVKVCYKVMLWFWWGLWSIPKVPLNSKTAMSLQYLKKEVRNEVDFSHADKHRRFLKVDFNTLASKFPTKWCYHYWWAWSSILKVLKVTNFQYLYNISKKKLGIEFIFCMKINTKVSTSWHYCFWWKWPDMSKLPKARS